MIIKNSIPRPMLVVPFVTKNGINKLFAKTHRLLGDCLRTHPGGPFYMGLAPTQNMPTGIGSGQLTTCGKTSAIASRQQPTNTISTKKPLINARRPIVANNSSTSVPPTNARRPSVVNGFLARRLHVVSAFSTRRLLVALWPNALLLHDRWQQPKLSSCGFAPVASTSGLPARLRCDSNARPLSHVCNTSRTAACARRSQRSSNDRQLQREQWLWPTRLTSCTGRTRWPQSNATKSQPNALWRRRRTHWPWSNAAKNRPNMLRRQWRKCWPRSNAAESWPNALRCWQRVLSLTSVVTGRRRNALQCWQSWRWPRNAVAENWQIVLQQWQSWCWPMSNIARKRPLAMQRWWMWRLPRSGVVMRRRQLLQCWLRRCSPRSNVATRHPRGRKRWPARPTSNVWQPRWRIRWPTMPTNNVERLQESAGGQGQ
jgi:hypothetical protein